MKTARVKSVTRIANHCYDGTQCETAIYAKTDKSNGKYKWYVGYGGDMMPATKSDIAMLTDISTFDNLGIENNSYVGDVVYTRRS